MPDPVTGLVVGSTSLLSSSQQRSAASQASDAQTAASEAGIAKQGRQFDAMRKLLEPYVAAGGPALQAQQAMLGFGGPAAQQAQIGAVENSPLFQSLLNQGEQGMLSNASATGGLRGGNLQGAMAQFRPQLLAQQLEDRYAKLGGLTSLGQQSATGVGTAGMQTGSMNAALMGQIGQAQAGRAIGEGRANASLLNMPFQLMGLGKGLGF